MRVLLLGGSGLLSGAALRAFSRGGHEVSVLSRGKRALAPLAGVTHLRADRTDAQSLREVLEGRRFDFAVDFLAFAAADVDRLLDVPGFEPGRLVMISSGQVYLVTDSPRPPFREADADRPLMSEPRRDSRDHGQWAYGIGKRSAEAALSRARESRGIGTLALRLPIVQGEADRDGSRRLWAWLERMLDGSPVLLPEEGRQLVRFVYAEDVGEALVALAMLERWPAFAAMNLAQPDEGTLREFLVRVAELAGAAPKFASVDRETLEQAGLADSCAPYWGHWVSRPDPTRASELLVARPRPLAEYLPGVVRAHLEQPRPESHQGYARRPAEVKLARRLGSV